MSAEQRAENVGEAGIGSEHECDRNEGRSEQRKVGLQCVAHDSLFLSGLR